MGMTRITAEVRRLLVRRHLREIHFSYGALRWGDVARAVAGGLSRTDALGAFEEAVADHLGQPGAVAFGSGRASFAAILGALELPPGAEVVVPGFTCVVVPQAVVHAGFTPVYADVDPRTFGFDPEGLARAIGPRTAAVVLQHSFGAPAETEVVRNLAGRTGAVVVEDCAHTLGGRAPDGSMLGTAGAASFFSTELTKVLNLGRGGFATSGDERLLARIREIQGREPRRAGLGEALRLAIARTLYAPTLHGAGRFALALLYRLGVLEASIPPEEEQGRRPSRYLAPLSEAIAAAGAAQIARLDDANLRRASVCDVYDQALQAEGIPVASRPEGTPLVRYPIWTTDWHAAWRFFMARQIELGRWFNHPVHPARANRRFVRYEDGTCPVGEWMAEHVANLPTHPGMSGADVSRVAHRLREAVREGLVTPLDGLPGPTRGL